MGNCCSSDDPERDPLNQSTLNSKVTEYVISPQGIQYRQENTGKTVQVDKNFLASSYTKDDVKDEFTNSMTKDFKPQWKDDESTTNCSGCGALFSVSNRKHHCRRCGEIFCNNCSLNKLNIQGIPERACNVCFKFKTYYLPLLNQGIRAYFLQKPGLPFAKFKRDANETLLKFYAEDRMFNWKTKSGFTRFSLNQIVRIVKHNEQPNKEIDVDIDPYKSLGIVLDDGNSYFFEMRSSNERDEWINACFELKNDWKKKEERYEEQKENLKYQAFQQKNKEKEKRREKNQKLQASIKEKEYLRTRNNSVSSKQ